MSKQNDSYRVHDRVQIDFADAKCTVQRQFKDECDINTVMRKFEKSGVVTHINERSQDYIDLIGVEDYHTSMNLIIEAQNLFDSIPAKIRRKFNNSPAYFLEFVQNPENEEELIKMGFAKAIQGSSETQNKKSGGEPPKKTRKASSGPIEPSAGALDSAANVED
ncbi:internal scaffolding protein [Microviridae sp.]|nr:internal scaffolding protein [Microviridae sp.]